MEETNEESEIDEEKQKGKREESGDGDENELISDLFKNVQEETYTVDEDDISISSEDDVEVTKDKNSKEREENIPNDDETLEDASEMTIIKTTTEDEFGDVESTDDSVDIKEVEKHNEKVNKVEEKNEKEDVNIMEKKKNGPGEMPPILAEGELMRKIDFSNGSKYNYCFKSDNKKDCNADFAKARCGAVRSFHGCLTRERGCQFRFKFKEKKCCLMYSCVSRQQETTLTPSTEAANEESSGSTFLGEKEESSGHSTILAEESEEEDTTEADTKSEGSSKSESEEEIKEETSGSEQLDEEEKGDKDTSEAHTESAAEINNKEDNRNEEDEGTTHPDIEELNERYGSTNVENTTTKIEGDERKVEESSGSEENETVDVTKSEDGEDREDTHDDESSADYPSSEEDVNREFDQSEAEVSQCLDISKDECEESATAWCLKQQCFGVVLGQCQFDTANGTCCMRYVCTEEKMMDHYYGEEDTEAATETTVTSFIVEVQETEDHEMLNRLLGDNNEEKFTDTEKTNSTLDEDETGSGDIVKDILGKDPNKDRYSFERSSKIDGDGIVSEAHKKIVTDIKEGETIVHYFYRGVSDLTDALRPHHCAPSPLCMVSSSWTSHEVIILIVFRFWKTRTFVMVLSFSAQLTTPVMGCSATVWWTLPVGHLPRKVNHLLNTESPQYMSPPYFGFLSSID